MFKTKIILTNGTILDLGDCRILESPPCWTMRNADSIIRVPANYCVMQEMPPDILPKIENQALPTALQDSTTKINNITIESDEPKGNKHGKKHQ
jgi:hypothetical protein